MARNRRTLKHRGYLYAQQHPATSYLFDGVTRENVSLRRMHTAEAWRAGYLAAQGDARRARKK